MAFLRSSAAGRYRWVKVWLGIGATLALLMLINAVRDYVFVSRVILTQQVRHQMTSTTNQVEQHFRQNELSEKPLHDALAATALGEASVKLRDADGTLLDHVGRDFNGVPFSEVEMRRAFTRREPLFRIVSTPQGDFVMEAFSVRSPRRAGGGGPPGHPGSERNAADRASVDRGTTDRVGADRGRADHGGPRMLTLEVALPLKSADASVLEPIRRNLAIDVAAALALLATVVLTWVGLRSYVKGERLEEQLEIARQVQSKLLPDPQLQVPGVAMVTVYKPSERVGGDFYDVFAEETRGFAAVIGDVSGKGLPAALLMGVIHGAVRTAGWQASGPDHEAESRRLNQLLCERASGNRFASMFWCVYDTSAARLRYVNAGHCPPFLLGKRDGVLTVFRLDQGGAVLGLLPEAGYASATVAIETQDLLVMYSDGLVEATDAAEEEFGDSGVERLLREQFDQRPEVIRDRLMEAWTAHSPADQVQDDLTFTIIRF